MLTGLHDECSVGVRGSQRRSLLRRCRCALEAVTALLRYRLTSSTTTQRCCGDECGECEYDATGSTTLLAFHKTSMYNGLHQPTLRVSNSKGSSRCVCYAFLHSKHVVAVYEQPNENCTNNEQGS